MDDRLHDLQSQVAVIDGKLDRAIIHLEDHKRTVNGFDDRIALLTKTSAELSNTSRSLANSMLQMHAEKRWRYFAAILIAGIVGGISASLAHDALAHPQTDALQYTTEGKK